MIIIYLMYDLIKSWMVKPLVNLSNKYLSDFVAPIDALKVINTLDLSNNWLRTLPAEILNMTSLVPLSFSSLFQTFSPSSPPLISFPFHSFNNCWQVELNLSQNKIEFLPTDLTKKLPGLHSLDVRHNLLEDLPSSLSSIPDLDVSDNPLSSIPVVFRRDRRKVCLFLSLSLSILLMV